MKKRLLTLMTVLGFISTEGQTTISLVSDINTTSKNSTLEKGITHNGKYYFGAPNEQNSTILHTYDGVNAPTPAPGVLGASNEAGRNPSDMVVFNGKLYFNGYLSWKGNELMEYDFTNAPKMVHDIYSNGQASSQPEHLTVFNNKLYFVATELTNGRELWMYDGTNPPSLAADINPGSASSTPRDLIVYNNKLYFVAIDEDSDIELYEYDGVNAPKKYNVNTQTTGSSNTISSSPQYLTVCNDTLYFRAKGTDNIQDLYKFTQEDSFRLAYIWSGARRHIYPSSLASFNNKLYFNGIPQFGTYNLLEFDGTNAPSIVHEINGTGNASSPTDMTTIGDELFFRAFTSNFGWELYRYDGVDTPKLVKDMMPGNLSSSPIDFVNFNDDVLFVATDPVNGRELFKLETGSKTTGVPELVKDFSPGNESSFPFHLIEFKDKLYFGAHTGENGRELWEYDGTNPPSMVIDYTPGNSSSIASNFAKPIIYKDKLLYLTERYSKYEIMEYDGVNPATQIGDMYGDGFRTVVTAMIEFKGNIYFDGFKFSNRRELYKYDGDTITLVAEINPNGDANPGSFFIFKDKLYFSADDGNKGAELWAYDGTNPPTMVAETNELGNGYPSNFQELNGKLYFLASNGTEKKLYEYDGTNAPMPISQGNLKNHQYLTLFEDKLYFTAWDGGNQPELYQYNGTDAPTLVAEIYPGTTGSNARHFKEYNGKLYFNANSPTMGYEMWTFDGKDTASINHFPGSTGLEPSELYVFKGKLYFSGRTENNGYELFSLEAPQSTKGIKEIVSNIKTFPNPTNGKVTVQGFDATVEKITIYNTSGQLLEIIENQNSFDISNYTTGIYIVMIESKTTIGYSKLIKN